MAVTPSAPPLWSENSTSSQICSSVGSHETLCDRSLADPHCATNRRDPRRGDTLHRARLRLPDCRSDIQRADGLLRRDLVRRQSRQLPRVTKLGRLRGDGFHGRRCAAAARARRRRGDRGGPPAGDPRDVPRRPSPCRPGRDSGDLRVHGGVRDVEGAGGRAGFDRRDRGGGRRAGAAARRPALAHAIHAGGGEGRRQARRQRARRGRVRRGLPPGVLYQ